jgi:DnaJ-domain-containing protein 1
MSIGKRLIDLARSELNSLLDKAAEVDDTRDDRWGGDLGGLSDSELEAELQRRRLAREEAEEAARGPRPESARAGANAGAGARPGADGGNGPGSSRSGGRSSPPRRTAAGDEAVRRAYAALEVTPGSDFEIVRKSYRRLMRKYHPDLHGGSVEAQRAATDLTQRLTESYKLIEKQTRR